MSSKFLAENSAPQNMPAGHYTKGMMNGRLKRTDEESNDGLASDRQLLRQFVKHNDERAFSELVFRYGGLVLDVCRRILRDEHIAEDAFQATFLVLARRASRIRNRSLLAGWLYAVAYRTACRANAKRHRRREEELRGNVMAADDILAQVTSRYEQQLLDEELNSLPAKYREPLVLRYLLGRSNKQVASELGLRVGVVEGRIKRGKDHLRLRLTKRGVSLIPALAAVHVSSVTVEAATAEALAATTVQAAVAFRGGGGSEGVCSESARQLAEKELATMGTSTIATSSVATALVVVGLTVALAGAAAQPPTQDEGSRRTVVTTHAPPVALSPDGQVPVRLAAAEKKGDSDSSGGAPARRSDQQAASDEMLRAKYDVIDFKERNSAEEKILQALGDDTRVEFVETPLHQVIEFFKDQHGVNIVLDAGALADVGIGDDVPITRSLQGITLRSSLRLLLSDLELTYLVQHEVLLITTIEVADARMETHIYSLHRLGDVDSEAFARVIQNTIRPDTWRTRSSSDETSSAGGAKASKKPRLAAIEALPGCLVIKQSQHAHEEVTDLLTQLERLDTSMKMLQKVSDD